jgi:hypothetical protein
MKPTVLNFTGDDAIQKGATFRQRLEWLDSNEEPVVLTGMTARMQVRRNVQAPNVIVELTSQNGGIVLGALDGSITINMSATQTAAITVSSGVFDLELVSADGTVSRFIKGEVEFSPEVTR